jgi:hypothetical protein
MISDLKEISGKKITLKHFFPKKSIVTRKQDLFFGYDFSGAFFLNTPSGLKIA